MTELAFDVLEHILIGFEIKDLVRCKCVCKSWYSFISSPRFVEAHLNHTRNKDRNDPEFGYRRITSFVITTKEESWFDHRNFYIVGSCNGLVCFSSDDGEYVVTNPSTGELKKVKTPPYRRPRLIKGKAALFRQVSCNGFGFDSSADDYKVIAGFRDRSKKRQTLFYGLILKSNIWKVIGEVKYRYVFGEKGILCGGALHWFMGDGNKKVIISLDLSTDELKEIPQPNANVLLLYEPDDDDHMLGVIEECLCILSYSSSLIWVMKNNKWELYNHHCESRYDVAHRLMILVDSQKTAYSSYIDDGIRLPQVREYIRSSIFVKSLVSPHPHVNNNEGQKMNAKEGNENVKSDAMGNIRKSKRRRRRKRTLKAFPMDI